jgi:Flp pilus assembly protein TadB
MSKPLALFFAVFSVIWLAATAVALSHNPWLAALFALLAAGTIGSGFVVKVRSEAKRQK